MFFNNHSGLLPLSLHHAVVIYSKHYTYSYIIIGIDEVPLYLDDNKLDELTMYIYN